MLVPETTANDFGRALIVTVTAGPAPIVTLSTAVEAVTSSPRLVALKVTVVTAALYGPTNGPPAPTGAAPAGWTKSVPVSARARALRPRVVDRVREVRAEAGVAEGHQDDVGAVVSGPDDARDDVAVLPLAGNVEHRDRHDGHARIGDARDPLDRHVVGLRGDDPGEPRPVTGGVRHPVGAVEDGRARHDLAGEVRMEGVDSGVQARDRRRARGRHLAEHLAPA